MKHLTEIMSGIISDGRRAMEMAAHDERWYIMVRYRRTFKLCRTRREFMVVWDIAGAAACSDKGWVMYKAHGYSSHQEACDVIKEGA